MKLKQTKFITGTPFSEYPIAANTALASGVPVKLTAGKVVTCTATDTTPILGVTAEKHSGVADAINPRSNATTIEVFDYPFSIYECSAIEIEASTDGTASIVDTVGLSSDFANDVFIGGVAKCTAAVTGTQAVVGTSYAITDSVGATSILTIAKNTKDGDKFLLFPPIGFIGGSYAADTGGALTGELTLAATAVIPFKVIGHDIERNKILVYPKATFYNELS